MPRFRSGTLRSGSVDRPVMGASSAGSYEVTPPGRSRASDAAHRADRSTQRQQPTRQAYGESDPTGDATPILTGLRRRQPRPFHGSCLVEASSARNRRNGRDPPGKTFCATAYKRSLWADQSWRYACRIVKRKFRRVLSASPATENRSAGISRGEAFRDAASVAPPSMPERGPSPNSETQQAASPHPAMSRSRVTRDEMPRERARW